MLLLLIFLKTDLIFFRYFKLHCIDIKPYEYLNIYIIGRMDAVFNYCFIEGFQFFIYLFLIEENELPCLTFPAFRRGASSIFWT